MRLLLDTHIWLWSLLAPTHLSRRVARELEKRDNELWLSPINTWELLVLVQRGRVILDQDVWRWVNEALAKVPMSEAPLSHEIALESRRVDVQHEDPADRFLAATAKVLDLTLVTADERLKRCKTFSVLANR